MTKPAASSTANQQPPSTAQPSGDYLGYSVYAQTLWARIEAALNKDLNRATLGDDPLVVGIFGEWGAGKSKLLKLVEALAKSKLAAQQAHDSGPPTLTVPVYFQPWKYEHEKHLLVPLVLHLVQATQEALKSAPTFTQQLVAISRDADGAVSKATGAAHTAAQTARKWFPVLKEVVGSLSLFGVSIALPDEIEDWLQDAETVFASPEAKAQGRAASAKELRRKQLAYVDNGFHYYQLHELLQDLTRPGRAEHTQDLVNGASATDLRLNFVIFIDDLDRCLPEKAVETLELIKTIFNLESFAFVLALDEEVVERGIGHRYKDYALANKKPEMPITGFEYLEKIVHLPFRLPGLTREQARLFLERYEESEVATGKPERWWFAPKPSVVSAMKHPEEDTTHRPLGQRKAIDADLSRLVLNAFTVYVPRKLVRLVELLHQVQEVAWRRGKALSVGGADGTDVRVVVALVMLQLFQPDLYRLVRRKPQAFALLLAAFAARLNGYREFSDPALSDVDLWLWVVDESASGDNDWIQSFDSAKMMDAVVLRIAKKQNVVIDQGQVVRSMDRAPNGDEVSVVEYDIATTREQRSRAQNVKLPLVALIVEHRATQRHAFDPLRLFHALAVALEQEWDPTMRNGVSPAADVRMADYLELMVAREDAGSSSKITGTPVFAGGRRVQTSPATQPVRYPDRLFADITSDQPEVQANLVANNELEPDKVLEPQAAEHLLAQLKGWREIHKSEADRTLLSRGLQVMAPFVPPDKGRAFLLLVDPLEQSPFFVAGTSKPFTNIQEIAQAVSRAELWSAFGQDDRFDADRFYLPRKSQPEQADGREPIAGFVLVPKGPFILGAKGEGFQDNPPNTNAQIQNDFYMARYLTTVDQYACFVEAEGYGNPADKKPDWWDTLGWAWRIGQWNSQIKEDSYRKQLTRRKPELRGEPMHWAEQQAHGSCPATGLNWFEARAYANWLTRQLKAELGNLPTGYAVRLPTEAQWERAARAHSLTAPGVRQFPWGSDDLDTAHLNANLGASDIHRASPVGLFAPNPLGMCDLSGSVLEWQSNLYTPDSSGQDKVWVTDAVKLKTHDDFDQCDRPALRGGAWRYPAVSACASFRFMHPPDIGLKDVGFRVALSLAE